MKNKIITSALTVVLLVAGYVTWQWQEEKSKYIELEKQLSQDAQFLIDYALYYGKSAKYLGYDTPNTARIVYYENSGEVHAAIYTDGIFAELGIVSTDNQTGERNKLSGE